MMCLLGVLFYGYEYYLRVAPSVMASELKEVFSLSEAAFGHLAACYYYAYTPMQFPVGIIIDRCGVRRVLAVACLSCALGTYFFGTTTYLAMAQFGRFLVGFGSAFAYVGVLKISDLWLPKKYFALMAGVCTTIGMLGATSGQVVMTKLVQWVGWRHTLEYASAMGLIVTLLLWMVLRDKEELEPTPISAMLPQQNFVLLKSVKEIAYSPQIWITGLIGCLTFLPISGFAETWTVSFLTELGFSKGQAAIGSSMLFLGFASGGPCWGLMSDWMQSRRIPLMIGSFVAAICIGLAVLMPRNSMSWMCPLLFFASFFASAEILVFAISNDLSRSAVSASAASFINMLTMVGGMLLPPMIGKFLDYGREFDQILDIHDYSNALIVLPIALLIAGILSMLLKESYRPSPARLRSLSSGGHPLP
jgi:MFS family permease